MARILIEIDDSRVKAMLGRVAALRGDARPLLTAWAGIMLSEVQQNFAEEGRPRWAPLASSTIRSRTRRGYWPGKILQNTGGLYRSVNAMTTPTMAIVSSNHPVAASMHFGASIERAARSETFVRLRGRGRKNDKKKRGQFTGGEKRGQGFSFKAHTIVIPPRPFMALTADGKRKLVERGEAWIRERLKG